MNVSNKRLYYDLVLNVLFMTYFTTSREPLSRKFDVVLYLTSLRFNS